MQGGLRAGRGEVLALVRLRIEFGETRLVTLLLEQFDAQFGILQAGFAKLEQLAPLLILGQQVGERHLAGFHGIDDRFELVEGFLEGGRVGGSSSIHESDQHGAAQGNFKKAGALFCRDFDGPGAGRKKKMKKNAKRWKDPSPCPRYYVPKAAYWFTVQPPPGLIHWEDSTQQKGGFSYGEPPFC